MKTIRYNRLVRFDRQRDMDNLKEKLELITDMSNELCAELGSAASLANTAKCGKTKDALNRLYHPLVNIANAIEDITSAYIHNDYENFIAQKNLKNRKPR